jgi:hypothetical protein
MTHPARVQPKRKFRIATELNCRLFHDANVGRKYIPTERMKRKTNPRP